MGCTPFIILLTIGLASSLTVNQTGDSQTTDSITEQQTVNATSRRGRLIQEIIELPAPGKKTKRQIIKIPPSVSKVKLVQPPLNLRHNRAPQQFGRYPANFRSGGPWRPTGKKSQPDSDSEAATPFPYDPIKVKRNLKKPVVKDVSPEEFYRDEEYEYEDRKHKLESLKKHRQPHKVVKIKRKKPKQNVLNEYLINYEGDGSVGPEEGGPESPTFRETQPFHYDAAGSSIHMKEVPPPSLFPGNSQKQQNKFGQLYDEKFGTGLNVKKLPTKGRQVQSLFSQQYTTHNPHVTTNFGLGEVPQMNGVQYGAKAQFVDGSPFLQLGKYNQLGAAASDHVVTAVPAKTPGIQVIQPPQFRDVTVSHPSHPSRLMSSLSQQSEETSSQKATIRDILEQDCPGFDARGYCDSPPRYPMQQIKSMVKKCANLMEAMNTQPFDEPQEVYGFSKRSDIGDERGNNKSISSESEADTPSTWSRSSNDGATACISDLELTEPGYAKEANSGRWFVIVQHPDTTIQRIATDTCRSPGKSCGGLSEMKCTKMNSLLSKSTRCVQRHTYQRLISWDPETPDECPRMRVFRFPSACICHLGVI